MNSTTMDIELTASKNEESTKEDDEELTASKNEESTKEDDEETYMNDDVISKFSHNKVEMNSTTTDIALTATKNEESTKEEDEEKYKKEFLRRCECRYDIGWFEYKRDCEWIPFEIKDQIAFHKLFARFYAMNGFFPYGFWGEDREINGEKVKINLCTLGKFLMRVRELEERKKYRQGESPSGENIAIYGGVVQHKNESFTHVRYVMCPLLGLKKRELKSILQKVCIQHITT